MIIQLEEAKRTLAALSGAITELGSALRIDELRKELAELEERTAEPDFWNDTENSGKVLQRVKSVKGKISKYEALKARLDDACVLCEMGIEENDESVADEVLAEVKEIESEEEKQRIEVLPSGDYDRNNAIVSFHPGAGGTEAQDWAQMLYRMYTRWGEKHGYDVKLIDWLDGEEAGLGGVPEIVSDAELRLDPVEHGDIPEPPGFDHFQPFVYVAVGNPKVEVGVIVCKLGHRHLLDAIQAHQIVMVESPTIASGVGGLILRPSRIRQDGAVFSAGRNIVRYPIICGSFPLHDVF